MELTTGGGLIMTPGDNRTVVGANVGNTVAVAVGCARVAGGSGVGVREGSPNKIVLLEPSVMPASVGALPNVGSKAGVGEADVMPPTITAPPLPVTITPGVAVTPTVMTPSVFAVDVGVGASVRVPSPIRIVFDVPSAKVAIGCGLPPNVGSGTRVGKLEGVRFSPTRIVLLVPSVKVAIGCGLPPNVGSGVGVDARVRVPSPMRSVFDVPSVKVAIDCGLPPNVGSGVGVDARVRVPSPTRIVLLVPSAKVAAGLAVPPNVGNGASVGKIEGVRVPSPTRIVLLVPSAKVEIGWGLPPNVGSRAGVGEADVMPPTTTAPPLPVAIAGGDVGVRDASPSRIVLLEPSVMDA
jgi:hypothetical protein